MDIPKWVKIVIMIKFITLYNTFQRYKNLSTERHLFDNWFKEVVEERDLK